MDDLRDGQNLFFLGLSSHHLKTYWCAIVDIWVIWDLLAVILHVPVSNGSLVQRSKVRLTGLPVALIELATGLVVPFVSLRDRNYLSQHCSLIGSKLGCRLLLI